MKLATCLHFVVQLRTNGLHDENKKKLMQKRGTTHTILN